MCVCVCAYELILTSACATALLIKVGPTRAEGNFMTRRSVLSLQCYSHHFSSISFLVKHGQQPLLQHRPWELRSSRWKYSADPQHGSASGATQDKNQTHKVTWWSFVFVFDNIFKSHMMLQKYILTIFSGWIVAYCSHTLRHEPCIWDGWWV